MSDNMSEPIGNAMPQFTLRSLLIFVFFCALYFSQLSLYTSRNWISRGELDRFGAIATAIWFVWLAFAWFYVTRKLWFALVTHCFLHVFSLGLMLVCVLLTLLLGSDVARLGDGLGSVTAIATMHNLVGSTLSFPLASGMMLLEAFSTTSETRSGNSQGSSKSKEAE